MAGVANCNKLRITSRKQWLDQSESPNLQTISYNGRIGDSKSGVGAIVFNDKNGYHSQTGAYLTYAHHLLFSRNRLDLNMLSFGLSAGMMQYKLDESSFLFDGFDPLVSGITQSSTDFNLDFGFSYDGDADRIMLVNKKGVVCARAKIQVYLRDDKRNEKLGF